MGIDWIPVGSITAFWLVVGGVLPFFVPKSSPHHGITKACLIMTAVVCWMFWLYCYMAQMNPLIGPEMNINTLLLAKRSWGQFEEE